MSHEHASLGSVRYADMPDDFKERRPELSGSGVEFKFAPGSETKADFQKRRVELWIASYGNVDLGGDVILPGAAARTIEEDLPAGLIKLFWNHRIPLGPAISLEEHEDGLLMVGAVTKHADLDLYLAQIADGTAAHGSLAYKTRESETVSAEQLRSEYGIDPAGHSNVRVLKEIRVREGSTVIWPMNELARVVGLKENAMKNQPDERKSLHEVAEVISCLARIRSLTAAEWAEIDEEEAEAARQLIEEMTMTEKAIGRHLTKSSNQTDTRGALDRLVTAAQRRADALAD